jgi:hypothetical protein
VLQNYRARLPRSPPVVQAQTVAILEGGQVGDRRRDPGYYEQPIPVGQLAALVFNAYGADDHPTSVNYNASAPPMRVQVLAASLPPPTAMQVYTLAGVPILPSSGSGGTGGGYVDVPRNASGSYAVRLRPPWGRYSAAAGAAYCNITFRAVDGVTGVATAAVTATVVVAHVHRPPRPALTLVGNVQQGKLATLQLNGTVRDADATIAFGVVTALPAGGMLYAVWPNGTVASAPLTAPGPLVGSTQVAYRATIRPTAAQPVLTDAFGFALVDTLGLRSINATFSIAVRSALTGRPATSPQPLATEHTASTLTLAAVDVADTPRACSVRILAAPTKGTLRATTGTPPVALANGSVIVATVPATAPAPVQVQSFPLQYVGRPYFFTSPTMTWTGVSIDPALVAPDR